VYACMIKRRSVYIPSIYNYPAFRINHSQTLSSLTKCIHPNVYKRHHYLYYTINITRIAIKIYIFILYKFDTMNIDIFYNIVD
jgi:hypothetical protein